MLGGTLRRCKHGLLIRDMRGACRRGHKLWLLTGTDACLVKKRGDVNLAASPKAVPNPKPQVSWENRQGWLLAN